jgi:hypothetical protein
VECLEAGPFAVRQIGERPRWPISLGDTQQETAMIRI